MKRKKGVLHFRFERVFWKKVIFFDDPAAGYSNSAIHNNSSATKRSILTFWLVTWPIAIISKNRLSIIMKRTLTQGRIMHKKTTTPALPYQGLAMPRKNTSASLRIPFAAKKPAITRKAAVTIPTWQAKRCRIPGSIKPAISRNKAATNNNVCLRETGFLEIIL